MIVSSPSSAGACSPSRFSGRSHHESSAHHLPSSATPPPPIPGGAGAAAAAHIHRTPSRSRLAQGVEEIRTALKRHTVNAASQFSPQKPEAEPAEPSGDHPRGSMSAGPGSLGGGNRLTEINTTTTSTNANANDSSKGAGKEAAPPTSSGDSGAKRQLSEVQNVPPPDPTLATIERARSKRARPPQPAVKLLPRRYELADPNDLVVLISSMLMELIQYNDKIPLNEGRLTRFHSRTPPRISVRDYLQRLTTHATLSPPILLSMVYYIDRLCALYPAFTVSSLTVHRFLIASATVASKGLSDSFWTNKTYARVGGISVAELALLELEFLWRVEWRIVPQPEVLVDYYLSLVERCEGYQLEPEDTAAPNGDASGPANAAPARTA
ncbi:hypothetical protein VTN77DRAFT_3355 [Rasamsonia byssochlamydoides]|uniref:uncharacterized protein n=1 Tax=Rasamsonia byssochlamydoides TaxID=89139 RepID=UPI0037448963